MKINRFFKRAASATLALALVLCLSLTALAAGPISKEAAKEIAYADAGLSAGDVTSLDKLVRFRSGNSYYYKLVFRTAQAKYVYIVGTDGTIERRTASTFASPGTAENTVTITADEALAIALAQPDASGTALKKQEVELKYRNRVYYYEVEFKTTGGAEYEYDIDAQSGAVINRELESKPTGGSSHAVSITADEALAIALSHAKVSASDLKKQEIELDSDDHVYHYEVEFKTVGGVEYEYDIDAQSGAILAYECDK